MSSHDAIDQFFHNIEASRVDKEATTRFFFVFSRFEYALKQTGYLKNGDYAEPNWSTFAKSVKNKYHPGEHPELDTALTYLQKNPVGRQIVIEGQTVNSSHLDFEPITQNGQDPISFAIRSVQMIRNNLFHGGKFPSGPVTNPGRDSELLSAGLIVLAQCLEWNGRVREQFVSLKE